MAAMTDLAARLSRLPAAERARLLRHLRRDAPPGPEPPEAGPAPARPDSAQLDPAEYRRLTQLLPRGPSLTVRPATVHQAFAAQVASAPDAIAVVDEAGPLTYAELDRQARRLARMLAGRRIGPGQLVPVCVRRSGPGIAALLGILQAGAAYVPIDPKLPQRRIQAMLAGCGSRLGLADAQSAEALAGSGLEVMIIEGAAGDGPPADPRAAAASPDDRAYVLFTSGSSGAPKGVVVSHRAVHHFATAIALDYGMTGADTVLQFASLGFDVSVFEIFGTLLSGGRLVIVGDDERYGPSRLTEVMREHRVTVAELPPGLMPLLDPAALPDLRLVSVGGEPFPGRLVTDWARPGRRFVNGYGPTECTVAVTLFECAGQWERMPPIGRPLPNHSAFVLDAELRPVPAGAPGELCIAGPQVADGYLGQPQLTADRFPGNPYRTGHADARLYRTGDRARWTPDGNLEYLGRLDRQVKLRGFRIEPGEVEAAIMSYPDVRHAHVAVVDVAGRGPLLVGYLLPGGGARDRPDWADGLPRHLAERLPAYMVPQAFADVAEFPLGPSGKIDARALPPPVLDAGRPVAGLSEAGPATAGRIAAEVLAPLLAVDELPADADFFAAGGDSLLAIRSVAAVIGMFGVEVSIADFLEDPTARHLAALVGEQQEAAQGEHRVLLATLADIERPDPPGEER
jgi:amino acid adenylation domain-containing protein